MFNLKLQSFSSVPYSLNFKETFTEVTQCLKPSSLKRGSAKVIRIIGSIRSDSTLGYIGKKLKTYQI